MSDLDRLALGCAKFGLPDYPPGTRHPVSAEESLAILRRAWELGIRHFDTARHYGDAEDLLRVAEIPRSTIVTKLRPAVMFQERKYSYHNGTRVRASLVLIHSATIEQLQPGPLTCVSFKRNLDFGASVYTPEEARAALAAGLTVLQVPYHLLDRRFEPIFEEAHAQGATVYARQPFARGALLNWRPRLTEFGPGPWGKITPESCLRFALASSADYIVFGVSSIAQLEDAVRVATTPPPADWPDLLRQLRDWSAARPPLDLPSVWSHG